MSIGQGNAGFRNRGRIQIKFEIGRGKEQTQMPVATALFVGCHGLNPA